MDSADPPKNPAPSPPTPSSTHISRIPEDTIVYTIFPDSSLSPTLPLQQKISAVHSLHLDILSSLQPLTSHYIWHRDPFLLFPITTSSATACPCSAPVLPHLCGKCRFADAMDDEWFIVSLLLTISSQFPSLSISAADSDGQFLLIEAAHHLPRWLSPSSSPNRAFLRRGLLHILPRSLFPSPPPLPAALLHLSIHPSPAPAPAQSVLRRRISRALRNPPHCATIRVPLTIALVLRHESSLVSLAVEAFYDRDIDSMKHAAKMDRFGARSEEEMVRVSVKMSRAMYAQLVGQNFQAPRCYWMPGQASGREDEYKEAELGMKIACGMEMMYQLRRREGAEGMGGTWEAYQESLERSGYFEGLLPGSVEYNRRMEVALDYYRKSSVFSRTSEMLNAPVRRIDEILALPHSVDDFKSTDLPPSDDDSWLYSGEDELNAALEERQKEMEDYESKPQRKKSSRGHRGTNEPSDAKLDDFDLGDIVKSMQEFVHKVSSYEGAEVPKDKESKEVDIDAERFIKEMESVLGHVEEENVSRVDDLDDYTSSSEMEFDEFEDEDDLSDPLDEDNGDTFMDSYSDVLNQELKETTLRKTFIRANEQHSMNDNEGTSNASRDMVEELTPVDVDVNLVKNLLDSFSSQQGLPGPASNLLGVMGLKLPHDQTNGK